LGCELTNIGGAQVDFDQPHIFVSAVTSLTNIIDVYSSVMTSPMNIWW
jgi:hypothetical protein